VVSTKEMEDEGEKFLSQRLEGILIEVCHFIYYMFMSHHVVQFILEFLHDFRVLQKFHKHPFYDSVGSFNTSKQHILTKAR
jgi:hypothetical protein